PPFPGGNVSLPLGVVKIFAADRNAPVVGISQSCNAIEQCGFSRARCPEENREAGQRAEVNIQVEAALGIRKAFADADFELGRDRLWRRIHRHGPTAHGRRLMPYTIESTTNETMSNSSAVWFALE